jgi:hypothetical protein
VELRGVVREEAMRLVSAVVLGAESPVHVWEHGLFFEVYCAEYTAAYFRFLSVSVENRENRGLSAFYTFLDKKHGDFFALQVEIANKVLELFRR